MPELEKVNKTSHRFFSKRIHKTSTPQTGNFVSLEFVGGDWPSAKTEITLNDKFILRSREYFHLFVCPTTDCEYNTNRNDLLEKHIKSCCNFVQVSHKQKQMNEESIRKWCVDNKYVDANFYQTNFVTFDIETLASIRNEQVTASTFLHNIQRVVTISVTKSWGPQISRTKVFKRKSFSQDDYETLINDFLSHLHALQSQMVSLLPNHVEKSIEDLQEAWTSFQKGERNYSPAQSARIAKGLRYLKQMKVLKVYGYNSSGFDLPVLFQGN